jgi:hypothetical protein
MTSPFLLLPGAQARNAERKKLAAKSHKCCSCFPGGSAFRQERKGEHNFVAIDLPFVDKRFSLVVVISRCLVSPLRDAKTCQDGLTFQTISQ